MAFYAQQLLLCTVGTRGSGISQRAGGGALSHTSWVWMGKVSSMEGRSASIMATLDFHIAGFRFSHHRRTSWVWMGKASSMEGRSASIMAVSPKSYTTCCRMSRSAVRPSARKMTKIGRSVRM